MNNLETKAANISAFFPHAADVPENHFKQEMYRVLTSLDIDSFLEKIKLDVYRKSFRFNEDRVQSIDDHEKEIKAAARAALKLKDDVDIMEETLKLVWKLVTREGYEQMSLNLFAEANLLRMFALTLIEIQIWLWEHFSVKVGTLEAFNSVLETFSDVDDADMVAHFTQAYSLVQKITGTQIRISGGASKSESVLVKSTADSNTDEVLDITAYLVERLEAGQWSQLKFYLAQKQTVQVNADSNAKYIDDVSEFFGLGENEEQDPLNDANTKMDSFFDSYIK